MNLSILQSLQKIFIAQCLLISIIGCSTTNSRENSSAKTEQLIEEQIEKYQDYQPTQEEQEAFQKFFRSTNANILSAQILSEGILRIESSKSGVIEIYSTFDLKTAVRKDQITASTPIKIPLTSFSRGNFLIFLRQRTDNSVEDVATFTVK